LALKYLFGKDHQIRVQKPDFGKATISFFNASGEFAEKWWNNTK